MKDIPDIHKNDTYELERPMREAKKRRQQEARESEQEEKWIDEDREERK